MYAHSSPSPSRTRDVLAVAVFIIGSLAVALAGCDMANQAMQTANNAANNVNNAAGGGGCKADSDCKGNRVCQSNVCVDPATGKPDPAANSSAATEVGAPDSCDAAGRVDGVVVSARPWQWRSSSVG